MNNNKIPQIPEAPKFPDISRYTRWLNEMEEKERRMSPEKRLYKWVILISVLFLLFVRVSPEIVVHTKKIYTCHPGTFVSDFTHLV